MDKFAILKMKWYSEPPGPLYGNYIRNSNIYLHFLNNFNIITFFHNEIQQTKFEKFCYQTKIQIQFIYRNFILWTKLFPPIFVNNLEFFTELFTITKFYSFYFYYSSYWHIQFFMDFHQIWTQTEPDLQLRFLMPFKWLIQK